MRFLHTVHLAACIALLMFGIARRAAAYEPEALVMECVAVQGLFAQRARERPNPVWERDLVPVSDRFGIATRTAPAPTPATTRPGTSMSTSPSATTKTVFLPRAGLGFGSGDGTCAAAMSIGVGRMQEVPRH